MKRALELCFDRRVLAGLGALAVAIWLLAPQFLLAALPVLVLLLCPLSMLLMASMMRGRMGEVSHSATGADRLAALEREQARLATEIARARGEVEVSGKPADPRSA